MARRGAKAEFTGVFCRFADISLAAKFGAAHKKAVSLALLGELFDCAKFDAPFCKARLFAKFKLPQHQIYKIPK
nr:hypothetical protein [uncultured Campylobacter sp.]